MSQDLRPFCKEQDPTPQTEAQKFMTAQKRVQTQAQDFQSTPKMVKKVQLYDESRHRHKFVLYRDGDVGIPHQYQDVVMETWNDDDRRTNTTQMERGMRQTMDDLYQILIERRDEVKFNRGSQ